MIPRRRVTPTREAFNIVNNGVYEIHPIVPSCIQPCEILHTSRLYTSKLLGPCYNIDNSSCKSTLLIQLVQHQTFHYSGTVRSASGRERSARAQRCPFTGTSTISPINDWTISVAASVVGSPALSYIGATSTCVIYQPDDVALHAKHESLTNVGAYYLNSCQTI